MPGLPGHQASWILHSYVCETFILGKKSNGCFKNIFGIKFQLFNCLYYGINWRASSIICSFLFLNGFVPLKSVMNWWIGYVVDYVI